MHLRERSIRWPWTEAISPCFHGVELLVTSIVRLVAGASVVVVVINVAMSTTGSHL